MISEKLSNSIIKSLPWLLSLVVLLRLIDPNSAEMSTASVALMVFCTLLTFIVILRDKASVSVSMSMVAFLVVCAFSILTNYILDEYNPWRRLIFFILFLCCYGPLIITPNMQQVKRRTLKYICIAIVFFCVFAMITYTTKLIISGEADPFWPFDRSTVVTTAGACAVALIYLFHRIFEQRCRHRIKLICMIVALVILSAMLLVAGSRAALAGASFAMIVSISGGIIFGKRRFISLKTLAGVILSALFIFSMVKPFTYNMEKKVEVAEAKGSYLSSRTNRWENRVREFKESPLIGVGFSSYRYRNTALNPFDDVSTVGRVEPGSSWLFLLSSLGLAGFIAFSFIYIKRIHYNVKNYSTYNLFILSLLAFLAIHMTTEGYVVAAGSPLCPILWLALMKRKNAVS